jgi:hypothetical protein
MVVARIPDRRTGADTHEAGEADAAKDAQEGSDTVSAKVEHGGLGAQRHRPVGEVPGARTGGIVPVTARAASYRIAGLDADERAATRVGDGSGAGECAAGRLLSRWYTAAAV